MLTVITSDGEGRSASPVKQQLTFPYSWRKIILRTTKISLKLQDFKPEKNASAKSAELLWSFSHFPKDQIISQLIQKNEVKKLLAEEKRNTQLIDRIIFTAQFSTTPFRDIPKPE